MNIDPFLQLASAVNKVYFQTTYVDFSTLL
jgi:hypothetical protein